MNEEYMKSEIIDEINGQTIDLFIKVTNENRNEFVVSLLNEFIYFFE